MREHFAGWIYADAEERVMGYDLDMEELRKELGDTWAEMDKYRTRCEQLQGERDRALSLIYIMQTKYDMIMYILKYDGDIDDIHISHDRESI